MHIEQFFHHLPLPRLESDLVGRQVTIELLLIDNSPHHLTVGEERFLERYPFRQPSQAEVRDFTAFHYTSLLQVWNQSQTGWPPRPGVGPEDSFNPAVRLLTLTTTITGFKQTRVANPGAPILDLVVIENAAGLELTTPLHPSLDPGQRDALVMTITHNPATGHREYTIRFYNLALVLSPVKPSA